MIPLHGRGHRPVQQRRVARGQGQGDQVVVAVVLEVRPRLQGGHLAIAAVQQPATPQDLPQPDDQRQVERVVIGVSRVDRGGEDHAGGLGGGGHELQLGQVRAMVLALAPLHQAAVGDGMEAVRGGAVEADLFHGELVHLAGARPEPGFQVGSGLGGGEVAEQDGQAVVGEVGVADRLADEAFQGGAMGTNPVADGRLAVIGLGEDIDDPDGGDSARGEPLMEVVPPEVLIEDIGELQARSQAEDQGDVVDPFMVQVQDVPHGGLPHEPGVSRGL